MKKILSVFCCIIFAVMSIGFTGCGKADLRVFNCYDYIDKSLIKEFKQYYYNKTGENIKIQYSCFDTPEDAYNKLKIDSSKYDILCPSDYMVEKMAKEGMLEEIVMPSDGNYVKNLSPFVKEKLEEVSWEYEGETKNLSNYAVGYMWGTLGMVYNPQTVNDEDMTSWQTLWGDKYNGKFTIKDSVRDTFFVALSKYHYNELIDAQKLLDGTNEGKTAYKKAVKTLFNDTSADAVDAVKQYLFDLKDNSKGMEVDEGKDQIIKGDIDINLAWSGDAVYAITEAADNGVTLKYSVPKEGSNVWFDGWCMPKGTEHKELAIEFLDFLSAPQNVIKNMEYIGYVSCVAGEDVFNWVKDNYGSDSGEYTVDLNYFFGDGNHTVKYAEKNGQFNAQYPEEDVINRCAVMEFFPEEANDIIMDMWMKVKSH